MYLSGVDNGEGYACVRAEVIWQIFFQFCHEPKAALKTLSLKTKTKTG